MNGSSHHPGRITIPGDEDRSIRAGSDPKITSKIVLSRVVVRRENKTLCAHRSALKIAMPQVDVKTDSPCVSRGYTAFREYSSPQHRFSASAQTSAGCEVTQIARSIFLESCR